MRLLGAILAGGRATRFGSDKALAALDGRPLIEHAARLLAPVTVRTVVCGRTVAPDALVCIPDWPSPDLGPLGGLCAALRHAAAHGFDAVLSLGCDTPALPEGALDRLIAGMGGRFLATAPIIGYWPVALGDVLSRSLEEGTDRSVRRWAASIGAEAIAAGGDVPNVNRPGDLAYLAAGRAR